MYISLTFNFFLLSPSLSTLLPFACAHTLVKVLSFKARATLAAAAAAALWPRSREENDVPSTLASFRVGSQVAGSLASWSKIRQRSKREALLAPQRETWVHQLSVHPPSSQPCQR